MEEIKIKKYINAHLNSTVCNLKCSYCYVAQRANLNPEIHRVDSVDAFLDGVSLKRMGGTSLFNICAAGETMLHPDIVDIIVGLIEEGHFISVVTNGTCTSAFDKLLTSGIEIGNIFFKFSFHYLELLRTKNLETFIENVNKVKNAGGSFTVEIVGSDDNVPHQDEIKELSLREFGALPHVTIPRDDRTRGIDLMSQYSLEEYENMWASFDSELFRFKIKILYKKIDKTCMAGEKALFMDIVNGNVTKCLSCPTEKNLYDTNEDNLTLDAIGNNCPLPYCYNGHVYLTLGLVEDIKAPTYFDVRNRRTKDGRDWVTGNIASIFKRKFYEE